jgi:hypothetical protein
MQTPISFSWDSALGSSAISAMAAAPVGPQGMDPHTFAQGAMSAMVAAELLAAQAGVVPYVTVTGPTGATTQGIVQVGYARQIISSADPTTQAAYLQVHAAVSRANAGVADKAASTPDLVMPTQGTTIAPLVVALICIGVAAVIGTAGYLAYTQGQEIEVQGQNLRAIAASKAWADTMRAYLARGVKPPDAAWGALPGLVFPPNAQAGQAAWWTPIAVTGGLVAVGVAGFEIYQNMPRRKRGR